MFFSFGNHSALDRLKLVREFVQILCFSQRQMSENLRNEEGWKGLQQVTFCFSVWQPFEYGESTSAKVSKDLKTTGKKIEEKAGSDKSLVHKVIGCQDSVSLKMGF